MKRLLLLTVLLVFTAPAAARDAPAGGHSIGTDSLRLTFSDSGDLVSAITCFPACSAENPRIQQFGSDGVVAFEPFTSGAWTLARRGTASAYVLEFRHTSGAAVTWSVPSQGYLLEMHINRPGGVSIRSGASFRPREAAGFAAWLEQSRYLLLGEDGVRQVGFDEAGAEAVESVRWVGYRNRFWTLLAAPPGSGVTVPAAEEGRLDALLTVNSEPGAWSLYIGPVEPGLLKAAAPGLDDILYAGLWSWLRWICLGLHFLLGWIALYLPSWGLAVMALSLVVGLLMWPLQRIADRYQQEVNEIEGRIGPEMRRIKQAYKGQEQSEKILALYKAERVHPLYSLKGLLGVALLIPVFIGAFNMLAENIHLLNVPFLWIGDLSQVDRLFTLPLGIPFFGDGFNLLPLVMTALSLTASVLHQAPALDDATRRRQRLNLVLMALAFFVLFYTFPAGMVLYWATTNLISVVKSLWARR